MQPPTHTKTDLFQIPYKLIIIDVALSSLKSHAFLMGKA